MIDRRLFLGALLGAPLTACQSGQQLAVDATQQEDADLASWYFGSVRDAPYEMPLVDWSRLPPEYRSQTVAYEGTEEPGTIVVDIDQRFLYLVEPGGEATRYAIGVGKDGFSWRGRAVIGRKAKWPAWSPTATMVSLKPELPRYVGPGVDNPLGARALYLHQNDEDTLFRIHGTNEPWSIGQAVSSGCVRMMNEDVVDLYDRVSIGTPVLVRRNGRWRV